MNQDTHSALRSLGSLRFPHGVGNGREIDQHPEHGALERDEGMNAHFCICMALLLRLVHEQLSCTVRTLSRLMAYEWPVMMSRLSLSSHYGSEG